MKSRYFVPLTLALVISAALVLGHPRGAAWAQLQGGNWCQLRGDSLSCGSYKLEMNGDLVEIFHWFEGQWNLSFRGHLQGNSIRGTYNHYFPGGCTPQAHATATVSNNGTRIDLSIPKYPIWIREIDCSITRTKRKKEVYILKPW